MNENYCNIKKIRFLFERNTSKKQRFVKNIPTTKSSILHVKNIERVKLTMIEYQGPNSF